MTEKYHKDRKIDVILLDQFLFPVKIFLLLKTFNSLCVFL